MARLRSWEWSNHRERIETLTDKKYCFSCADNHWNIYFHGAVIFADHITASIYGRRFQYLMASSSVFFGADAAAAFIVFRTAKINKTALP